MKKLLIPLLLSIFTLFPTFAFSQIEEVTVEIEGMTCPFCNFGVEKVLDKVTGVKDVKVDLKHGAAVLTAKSGKSIHMEEVYPAIDKAGFTILSVEWQGIGQIQKDQEGELFFVSPTSQKPIHIYNSDFVSKQASKQIQNGQKVQIKGKIRDVQQKYICVHANEINSI